MALTIVTAPAKEPISEDEARGHLRLDAPTPEDIVTLSALITAARQVAESMTGRALITQTWELAIDCFPAVIYLPLPPLQLPLTSIKYIDVNGNEPTLAEANYRVDARSEPARIIPAYGLTWPSTRSVTSAVVVKFVAGYGDDPGDVPQPIRSAMLLMLGHLYEHRESVTERDKMVELPLGVSALLWPYVIPSL